MLVSWDWLSQYVPLKMKPDELATRLALSGLNHESTSQLASDTVIDLEVTSNRGDCLGHLGIAREVAVLYNLPLTIPNPQPPQTGPSVASQFQVINEYSEGCPRYTARILRGVTIGPSPAWLSQRLEAVGIKSINNVVDVTNYVMMECGQPLHAFDLAKLQGSQIRIRSATDKEAFEAIDHRTYSLSQSMIVIADANRAVALGGVMGGAQSEVSDFTTDLLIEAADFTPLLVRRAARGLRLHSPSSYRFERRVDPLGIDWASRRCCDLILQLAGGQLQSGLLESHPVSHQPPEVTLHQASVTRVLGIEVPWNRSVEILQQLGCECHETSTGIAKVHTPSWRHDLTRDVDLIEEIARVYGYDQIPEDVAVPITPSLKRPKDVLLDRVRSVAIGSGFDEALTPSLVTKTLDALPSYWSQQPPLATRTSLLEGANLLRRSLIPSLIQARLHNQTQSAGDVHLFETAVIYLPGPKPSDLPTEQVTLGLVTSQDLRTLRGVIEELLLRCCGHQTWETQECQLPLLQSGTGLEWQSQNTPIACLGQLSRKIKDSWKIDRELCVAEVNLDAVLERLLLVPKLAPISPYPAVERDLNLIVDEPLRWDRLSQVIRQAAGPLLVQLQYRETYRDPKRDGPNKKRILFGMAFQSPTQTLTTAQVDEAVADVLNACQSQLAASLLA